MLLSIPDCDEASDAAETDLAPSPVLPPGVPAQPPTKAATYLHPAFAQRVEGEIPFLRRAARRWRPHPADADDLVQETLLRALANAHLWQAGSDLRGWLFTIMRNQFFAVITQSNRSSRALEAIAGSDREAAQDPHETRLILRDVRAALGRLPRKQRDAVLLVGIEGKSYGEVAQIMGTSVSAIRCHLARGRDRLRAAVHAVETRPPFALRPAGTPPAATCPTPREIPAALAFAGAD